MFVLTRHLPWSQYVALEIEHYLHGDVTADAHAKQQAVVARATGEAGDDEVSERGGGLKPQREHGELAILRGERALAGESSSILDGHTAPVGDNAPTSDDGDGKDSHG